jgi:hypothetical protein
MVDSVEATDLAVEAEVVVDLVVVDSVVAVGLEVVLAAVD